MSEEIAERIVEQRLRNRIIEVVEVLASGDDGVRYVGPAEFFEAFYDFIPHHSDHAMYPNSAISPAERKALKVLSAILDQACDSIPRNLEIEEFIETGWPKKIQNVAQNVHSLMIQRGYLSEEKVEENCS